MSYRSTHRHTRKEFILRWALLVIIIVLLVDVALIVTVGASAEEMPTPVPTATYTPPIVNCEEGTAPGWLNEQGDPTSCVDDHAVIETPIVVTEETPEMVQPATVPAAPVQQPVLPALVEADVPALAETGPHWALGTTTLALAALFIGAVTLWITKGKRS